MRSMNHFSVFFSVSCMCEDLGLWRQRDNRQTDRQLVMRTNRRRRTECVRKASYGVETLWETKAQGQWNDCFWLQQFNTHKNICIYIYIYTSLHVHKPFKGHTTSSTHTFTPISHPWVSPRKDFDLYQKSKWCCHNVRNSKLSPLPKKMKHTEGKGVQKCATFQQSEAQYLPCLLTNSEIKS